MNDDTPNATQRALTLSLSYLAKRPSFTAELLKEGHTIVVTESGVPIGTLTPLPSTTVPDRLASIIESDD
jgi:hypothetical protein